MMFDKIVPLKKPPTALEKAFIRMQVDTLKGVITTSSQIDQVIAGDRRDIASELLSTMQEQGPEMYWRVYNSLAEIDTRLKDLRPMIIAECPDSAPVVEDAHFIERAGKRLLKLSTIEDIYNLPDAVPLVAGVLEVGSISMLYGLSGTGKTFTGLDLALSVCHGLPWHGRKVQQGIVWYVNTEGGRSLKRRLQAWYKEHDDLSPDLEHFKIIPWSLDLREHTQETINTIEDQNEPPALIIVDNFSMCAPGVDQNKQEQVAPVLRLLNALASEYNTHIMVIHHTNKGGDINGTMAFRNHVDTMIELVKEDAADRDSPILFRCMKARDSEPFRDIRTELKSVVLYTDPKTLETTTSCIVTTSVMPEKVPRDGLKDVEQNILDILGERQLAYTEWQNESIKELSISTATFSRVRTTLENKGMIAKVKKEGKRFEAYHRIVKESSAWNE